MGSWPGRWPLWLGWLLALGWCRRLVLWPGRRPVPEWCSSAGLGTPPWCCGPPRSRPGSAGCAAVGQGVGHQDVGGGAELVGGQRLAFGGDDLGPLLPFRFGL